jgi:alkanesulfonate monooxygenase SsuD/methylene tetrahydromethanopterin reductase-like flavin-dependent oxidoreductase (luciferase family)
VKFAVNLPPIGDFADARVLAELARTAEDAGWDGFFLWDHVALPWDEQVADPWIALAARAMSTSHIKLGTMVTPLARRRPQKLARETATLDHLSNGRLILGVGLGVYPQELDNLGDEADQVVRAEMLDEALEVLTGLWSGEKFSHEGKHHTLRDQRFRPTPLQQPRIPVWVAGMWPNRRPFRRAAKWDGVFPIDANLRDLSPDTFGEIVAYTLRYRTSTEPFDVCCGGTTSGPEDTGRVLDYERAGVTWWQEAVTPATVSRIAKGPPRV